MKRLSSASLVLAVATTLVAAAAASAQPLQPGDQSRWSLDYRASMEQTSAHPIEIHMIGGWTSTVSAVRNGEYDAQLQLADLHFAGDAVQGASAASLSALQTHLSRPFWATYRNDGGLLAMHFLRDVSPSDRNLLQMIATELQLVRPDAARESWTAQERDGAGEYAALYVAPRPDRIVKRKLKYLYTDGVAGAPTNAVRVSVESSDIQFTLTPDGKVQGIDGTNRVRMDLAKNQSEKLVAMTEFHAGNLRTGKAPELVGSLEREIPNVVDSPVVTQLLDAGSMRADADERLLHGYTTEAILASAFAKDANPSSLDRLTALFRRRSEAASEAAAMLIQDGSRRSVTNALGAAGSVSSVFALNGLAHNSDLPENLRVDAIVALVQMQHPTAEAMRIPGDLVNDPNANIRFAARMMSGALSRAGRLEHAAEADAIDASLIALYMRTQDTKQRADLLGALGNSAGPSAVPVIEEALHDSTANIRAAAARSLRLAPGAEIDRVLANVITSDSDGTVRSDAIFATRFRNPLSASLARSVLSAASTDEATYVRSDAIAVLRQNPNASPAIPQTLKQIAEQDSDAGVRRQASEALESLFATASTRP
jgi:hypothetical protein